MNLMNIGLGFPSSLSWTLWAHTLAGGAALLTFLIPLFSKKGGSIHSRSGKIYAAGMLIVGISSFVVTPWRYFLDPARTQESQSFALFLFFISVFALTSLQQGLIVLGFKKREGAVLSIRTLLLPASLLTLSTLIAISGLATGNWLFVVFGALAFRTSREQVLFWKRPQKHPKDWWFFHLENMFTSCIATVTAFAVTALPRLFPHSGLNSLWVWIAPSVIMVPWQLYFIKKYEAQFAVKRS